MRTPIWIRDVLFVVCGMAGIGALSVFLMASDKIETPSSFQPDSEAAQLISQTARQVDRDFAAEWEQAGLEHAPPADYLTIVRRLSLGLAGTLPSVQEIREMELVPEEQRVDWFVSRLLEDKRSNDYLAQRFGRAFVGVDEGAFVVFRRRRFVSWLSEQLQDNRPYDELVQQMMTDDGIWTDSPAVNFYTYNIIAGGDEGRPDAIRQAARTTRAFLGMRIDCLQCHDDFLGTINLGSADDPVGGQQVHFHSLASFFSQVENSIVGIRDNQSASTYVYKLLDAESEDAITPKVPFHDELDDPTEDNLRLRLANWITHPKNKPFARAAVNRVWAIMFGRGIVDPVDDITLDGPFPPALETLADDFVAHDFDLKRLIRVIAATQVFQMESEADFEITDEHDEHWAVFPLIRLRPEQVAGSIVQSTSLITIDSTAHIVTRLMQFGQQNDFVSRFGDAGEEEFNERGETVTQRLLMLNGNMIQERLQNPLNSTVHIGNLSPDPETALKVVYLAALSRAPSQEELEHFTPQLNELRGDELAEKVQDIYWALINSVEFVWNH